MRTIRTLLVLLVAVCLSSCGGGGGGGSPAATPKVDVSGTISGLTGSLVLLLNGVDVNFTTVGTFLLLPQVSSGATYSVTVATQPAGQHCTVTNGSGTAGTSAPPRVLIDCVTLNLALAASASDLLSYRYDASTGQLTQASVVGGGINIIAVGFNPAANLAYAVDAGTGVLTLYAINNQGVLSAVATASPAGSNVQLDAFLIDPAGHLGYMLYWDRSVGSERMQAYAIGSSGFLAVSGGPLTLTGQLQVTSATLSASGSHALLLDATGLSQYDIGSAGWNAMPTANFPLGSTQSMAVNPVADVTLVSATDTGGITTLWSIPFVAPAGLATQASTPGISGAASALAFDPSGQLVLVGNASTLLYGQSTSMAQAIQPVLLSSTPLTAPGAASHFAFSSDSRYSYASFSGNTQIAVLKWTGGVPADVTAGLSPIMLPGALPVTALAFR